MADPFDLLARAVKADDLDTARHTLRASTGLVARLNDPMPGGSFGATILAPAVEKQNRAMIDLLLAHGADINQRSHWWAGSLGVLDFCEPSFAPWLIDRGARVDVHAAARHGMIDRRDARVSAANTAIAGYRVEQGANVDARDVDHESTPAQWMIRDRHEVAQFLVERGATADILMAAALGDRDRVNRLLDENQRAIRTRVDSEFFPMSSRQAGGSIYIWTLGANKTAHTVARDFHRDEVYALLVERSPETLKLALACEIGDEGAARAIVARHPNILDELPPDDARRLGDAAWDSNTAAVLLMLDLGWPVDASNGGTTPLHQAAWTGNVETVRALIDHGADVNARDTTYHGTAIGWANHGAEHNGGRGDPAAVIHLLRDAGGKAPGDR
jgi:ankyrin repeat protein